MHVAQAANEMAVSVLEIFQPFVRMMLAQIVLTGIANNKDDDRVFVEIACDA